MQAVLATSGTMFYIKSSALIHLRVDKTVTLLPASCLSASILSFVSEFFFSFSIQHISDNMGYSSVSF